MKDAEYLNEQETATLRALLALFEQPGWAEVVRNAQRQLDELEKRLEYVDDIRDLKYLKGSIDTLRSIRDYEDRVLADYEALVESRREDELEIEESRGSQE